MAANKFASQSNILSWYFCYSHNCDWLPWPRFRNAFGWAVISLKPSNSTIYVVQAFFRLIFLPYILAEIDIRILCTLINCTETSNSWIVYFLEWKFMWIIKMFCRQCNYCAVGITSILQCFANCCCYYLVENVINLNAWLENVSKMHVLPIYCMSPLT